MKLGRIVTISNVISNLGLTVRTLLRKTGRMICGLTFRNGNDGWYYYDRTLGLHLAPSRFSHSIGLSDQTYNIYNYDLSFRFEAVQADAAAALALWGKTVTVENGEATWQL